MIGVLVLVLVVLCLCCAAGRWHVAPDAQREWYLGTPEYDATSFMIRKPTLLCRGLAG